MEGHIPLKKVVDSYENPVTTPLLFLLTGEKYMGRILSPSDRLVSKLEYT